MIPAVLFVVAVLVTTQAPTPPTCTLRNIAERWEGSCGSLIEGEKTSLSIASASAIATGAWRQGETPRVVWAGTMVVGSYPATPIEIEVHGEGTGAIRTVFGWFSVSRFVQANDALELDIDSSHEVPPSAIDRGIIKRAMVILSAETAWNRSDNRDCPGNATTWSIFCALQRATIDVAGAFHHRRPALQVVRRIVDERTTDRPYEHRLMDYNNDPTTKLEDVQTLFREALKRIDAARASETPRADHPRGAA